MAASSVSPSYNTTTDDEAFGELETALRRQIKSTLDGMAISYDRLDSRVQVLEQRLPKNLRFRLKTIEDHVTKTQEATIVSDSQTGAPGLPEYAVLSAKINAVDADLNTIVAAKISTMQIQLDQHKRNLESLNKKNTALHNSDPVVQDLLQRLHKLENKSGRTAALDAYTNDQIAEELLQRLTTGGGISSAIAARLHTLTAEDPSSQPEREGHSTELSHSSMSSTADRKSSTSSDVPRNTRNRALRTPAASSSLSELSSLGEDTAEQRSAKRTRVAATTGVKSSPRKISSMWKSAKYASTEVKASFKRDIDNELSPTDLEALLQDEPRRSGRASKPARNPQFMTWLEVAAAKKRKSLE